MQIILRLLLGIFTIFAGYHILQSVNFYDESLFSVPEILILIPGIAALYLDYINFRASRRLYQFVTSFAWVVVYTIIAYYHFDNHLTDEAATVFTVVSTNNEREFEFKQNDRLIITEVYSLGRDIYYCRYKKQGDTLIIKSIPNGPGFTHLPTTGIIRRDTVFWNNHDTTLISK